MGGIVASTDLVDWGWGWDVHCTAIIFIEGHLRPLVGLLPQTGQLRTLSDHRPVVAVSVHKKS